MATPKFPTRRFARAGATKDETAALAGEFERSDIGIQESVLDYFTSQSSAGLREYLANWRLLQAPAASQRPARAPRSPAKAAEVSQDPPEEPEPPVEEPTETPEDEDTPEPDEE